MPEIIVTVKHVDKEIWGRARAAAALRGIPVHKWLNEAIKSYLKGGTV